MRRRLTFAGALVVVLLLLAGCGGNGGSTTATPRPAVEPTISTTPVAIGTPADAALAGGLLTADDLGSGWVAQPTEGATVADNYYCGTRLAPPPVGAFVLFANEEQGRAIVEQVSRLPDANAAAGYVQSVRDAHANCSDYVSTDGNTQTEWHTDSFGSVAIGDEAVLEQATMVSGTGITYGFVIRRGAVLLSFATIGAQAADAASADNARIDATTRARQAYEKLAGVLGAGQ